MKSFQNIFVPNEIKAIINEVDASKIKDISDYVNLIRSFIKARKN